MKIIIFYADGLRGRLMQHWTGCTASHAAFYDPITGILYEMDARRRKRSVERIEIIRLEANGKAELYDLPDSIPETEFMRYLENQVDFDQTRYGFVDYVLKILSFYLNKLNIKARFKNQKGMHCAEMVATDLAFYGYKPWDMTFEPPTPCEISEHFRGLNG